jgi:hypothetical protein
VRTRVLFAQGQDRLLDSTLRRAALTYKGTLEDFFQFLLAADDDGYYVVIVQYHWATSPARRIDDINSMPSGRRSGARLRSNAGGEEGYPGRRRAKTASMEHDETEFTAPPRAPLGGGVTAHRAAVRLSCGRYFCGGRGQTGHQVTGQARARRERIPGGVMPDGRRFTHPPNSQCPSRSVWTNCISHFQPLCSITGAFPRGCSRQESGAEGACPGCRFRGTLDRRNLARLSLLIHGRQASDLFPSRA